jgi:hypothetical protein
MKRKRNPQRTILPGNAGPDLRDRQAVPPSGLACYGAGTKSRRKDFPWIRSLPL